MLARPSSPPGKPSSTASGSSSAPASTTSKSYPPPLNPQWDPESPESRVAARRRSLVRRHSQQRKNSTTASGSSSLSSLASVSYPLFGDPIVTAEYEASSYLSKLYELVDDRDTDGVISWNDAGSGFVIHQPSLCENELLPKNFFKHRTLSAFVCLLTSVLGFVKAEGDQLEFSRNDFRRGRPLFDVHDLVTSRNADPIGGAEKSSMMVEEVEKEHMFDKVVMPSDVGRLNRLVIPKHQAEKYFPLLDGPSNEKGILLDFENGNGKPWRFRYSYWNSSQCYVITKGWSRFVKEKNLDAGDIISFLRGAREDSCHRLFIDLKRRPTILTHPDFPMALHLNLNRSLQPVSELSCVTTEADEIETTNEDGNLTFHDSEQELFTPRAREAMLERFLQKRADRLSSKKSSAVGEDDEEQQLGHRSSTFSSVMDDALKGDSLQNICSSLEPMLHQFVKEEVHHDLSKQGLVSLGGTSSAKQIEGSGGRNLQLHFRTSPSRTLFTGVKVEGQQGAAVHVVLLDAKSGHVVTSGPESSITLDVVPLDGDSQYDDDDWTQKEFQTHIVYEREGRRPLLTGDIQVTLKEGVGTLGDLAFTDNSSWIRSGKLKLGLKVASGVFEGIRIREAMSEAFRVKDHRYESFKKHSPPLLNDEVWRLEKIAKDGVFHNNRVAYGGHHSHPKPMSERVPDQNTSLQADEIETAYNNDKASEVVLKRFAAKRNADGEDDGEQQLDHKSSTFSRVMDDVLKDDSLQNIYSSLEPMLRSLVREEIQHNLSKLGLVPLAGRSSANRIEGSDGRNLQLHFRTNLSIPVFTGVKVEGEQGAAVHVVLLDANSGHIVTSGPESSIKLDVDVLDGDFQYEDDEDWTQKEFQTHVVKQREGRRPLLTGDLQVTLKEGVGTLGDLAFTDNSSWIRSGKLRLGLKVASGFFEGIRIREAKSEPFRVKNNRNESYKKPYPPLSNDEVWRLEKIAKNGVFHKRLNNHEIFTVEDFLHLMARDSAKLRNILGSGMSGRSWDALHNHAKTCVLNEKINAKEYFSVSSLSEEHIDTLVKKTFENQNDVRYDAKLHLNLKQSKGSSGSKNEYQGLTNTEEVQGLHSVGCAGRKDCANVWTVKGDQDHPIPLSVHADSLTRILCMRLMSEVKVHNLFGKVPKSLPSIFQANSFVELHLPLYNHRLLWAGKLDLVNLRLINLKHSSKLISLPDLSMAQKIVHLNLRGCVNLIQVSYIRNLTKLEKLNLSNCENIKVLPSLIGLQNLREFYLSGCSNLWNLPPSIIALNSLVVLDLKNCAHLCELPRFTRSLQKLNISGCTNILRSLDVKGNRESQLSNGSFLNRTISGTYRYERASQFVEEATSPEQKKSTTKKAKKISAPEVVQVETTVEKELTIKNFNWKAKMEKEERKRKFVESATTTCKEVRVKRICNYSDGFVSSICQPSHEALEEAILDSGSKLIDDTEPAPPGWSPYLKENTLAGLAIEDQISGEGEDVGLGIQMEPEVISLCNSSDHPREECSERVQLDVSKTAAPCGPHKFAEKSCDGGMESNTEVFSHQTIGTEPLSSYEENDEIDWLKNEIQKLQEQLEASEKRQNGFRECCDSLESELWPLCAELEVEHVNLKEQKQKHEESELEASNAWEDLKNLVAQSIF